MLTIRTTTLLATIATTQAVDYFKASCTKVEAGTVFIDQFGNGKKTVVGPANNCLIVQGQPLSSALVVVVVLTAKSMIILPTLHVQ